MDPLPDSQNRAYYDDFSAGYERGRDAGYHALVDRLQFKVLEPYLRGADVLEVGCGTGLILEKLAAQANEAWGVDVSPGMLEKARARGLRVEQGSATLLPFPDARFDLVCSFKVLAHVPDIERAFGEFARVLKPDGVAVVDFYNAWSLRYLAKRIAGPQAISPTRTEADIFTRWSSPSDIRRLLPPSLRLVDVQGVRVVTPVAFVHRVPGLRRLWAFAEEQAMGSPLRYFGGFLVAVLRRQE